MSSESDKIVVKGHAFRPRRNPYSYRKVYAECECGGLEVPWPVTTETARHIHREHKKAVLREQGAR